MKLQDSPKIYALVARKQNKNWFLMKDDGEHKFASKFGGYCLFFMTKGQANSYIREHCREMNTKIIAKKITNIPEDQINLIRQDEMPKDSCLLYVIGENDQKLYLHMDRATNNYVVHPQQAGACVFTHDQAEQLKDQMAVMKSGMDVKVYIEPLNDLE